MHFTLIVLFSFLPNVLLFALYSFDFPGPSIQRVSTVFPSASVISTAIIKQYRDKVIKVRCERAKVLLLFTDRRPDCSHHPRFWLLLPSCKASFMMEAPRGSSWLQADLKKDSGGRETSSPAGLKPSHMPLKSCTFSSSRDMISASFRLNWSAQQSKGTREEIYIYTFFSMSILTRLDSPRQPVGVVPTSHLLCFGLQLPLVLFRLTGDAFVLVSVPVQSSKGKDNRLVRSTQTSTKFTTNIANGKNLHSKM